MGKGIGSRQLGTDNAAVVECEKEGSPSKDHKCQSESRRVSPFFDPRNYPTGAISLLLTHNSYSLRSTESSQETPYPPESTFTDLKNASFSSALKGARCINCCNRRFSGCRWRTRPSIVCPPAAGRIEFWGYSFVTPNRAMTGKVLAPVHKYSIAWGSSSRMPKSPVRPGSGLAGRSRCRESALGSSYNEPGGLR